MVELIVGKEGKGKTKQLLERVNSEIKTASGNIVFIDRNDKHMFELNNKVRLVNVAEYDFTNSSEFLGFVCGILSQDHDIEQMYIDAVLKVAKTDKSELAAVVKRLDLIGKKFNVKFTASVTLDASDIAEEIREYIAVEL
ncbi:MAG: twitching motility protein PilT [Lachnospiraceae bacterium]|nr:twitching motility protein PilT [Lachnospiraceae bacterium]